ncbi:hypothetical protein M569_01931 [Genlisea aurea]|uniref:S-protein homolog n=1 Tax=Genlisea aurea TaxID=192259 RepID=S8EAB1_9LAMI|nr:hypothetical protein M569_01931 [Genlisea aurea]
MAKTPFLTTLLLMMTIETVRACFLEPTIDVFVVRNISSDSIPLTVHCFSGNDDLGNHTLYGNEYFHWSFCLNVIPNTKFFCHVWWGSKTQQFVAYDQKAFLNRPMNGWLARDDGIYLTHKYKFQNSVKVFDWE